MLAELAGAGVTHLALEASSHGIDQRRLDGVTLTAAGFTNLTQDHLDYHGDMDAYRAAKLRLFETLLPRGAHGGAERRLRRLFRSSPPPRSMAGPVVMGVGERGRDLALIAPRAAAARASA